MCSSDLKRRDFLRLGLAAAGAPAVLPLSGGVEAFLTPRQRRAEPGVLRLDSNENPLGIPEGARTAILAGLSEANRYPGASRRALVTALARKHGADPEEIVLGNGSTELIQMGVQVLAGMPLTLVAPTPTFEDVFRFCSPHPQVEVVTVPLTAGFAHDLDAMEARSRAAGGPVLVYVCNPNNPTGSLTPVDEVEAWIRTAPARVHFLVDEAYFEFPEAPGYRTLIPLARELPTVVVLRTFSKVYGMAGLRLGYAVAHPETAERVRAFAPRTNTNQLALVAAAAALEDDGWVARAVEANRRSRTVTYEVLEELDLEYIPSHTNFVMHRIRGDLRSYIRRMADAGIQVGRPFPPMLGWNRLSLGLPSEMERFAETLRDFRRRGWI